jgi:Zn-dependent peptidase ImmA (M78 family)
MVILSFRYLSDDHFWFTFFHEAGHLLLHPMGETFVDGGAAEHTDKEADADAFSTHTLVPSSAFAELPRLRARSIDVIRFARSVGVSPGIIVGQMQHHGYIGPQQLNKLKRRYSWDAIQAALV